VHIMFKPTPMSQFDLPGLNLPLNWTPSKGTWGRKARGGGRDLIHTALNETDMSDGWTA